MQKRVDVSPSELTFDLSTPAERGALSTVLRISNPLAEDSIVFKVKTTAPKRYLVKPNQDVLAPGQHADVLIQVQDGDRDKILENSKDKFLVATLLVNAQVAAGLKSAPSQSAAYTQLWDANKEETVNRKIQCTFVGRTPAGTGAARGALPVTPAYAPPTPAANLTATKPAAAPPAAGLSSTTVSASQDSNASFESLSKSYKETLALLVQITQERDLAVKRLRELQQASASAASALQNTPAKQQDQASAASDTKSQPKQQQQQGFLLWHLLLVALVSVLLTRWLLLLQEQQNQE